jgi:hypothetical protein
MNRLFIALLAVFALTTGVYSFSIEPNGVNQDALYAFLANAVAASNNRTLGAAGFVNSGAAAATYNAQTSFNYQIENVIYSRVGTTTVFPSFTAAAQAVNTSCYYLACIDSVGTVSATKGTAVTYGLTPVMPKTPASKAVFGALKVDIKADATAGFTLGTSNYNYDASCTITIYQMANGAPLTLTNFE